jgi:VCBS repeat-containing protein
MQQKRAVWTHRLGALLLIGGLVASSLGPAAIGVDGAKRRGNADLVKLLANPAPIAITDNTTSPPSTIEVSGFESEIEDVNVRLNVYSHTQPADVDVLLVGPQGQTAMIMSDVAGASKAERDSLILDDQAAMQLPRQDDLTSGVFKPTNYEFASLPDKFAPNPRIPSPLPSNSSLSIFNGTDPNGTWTLFVVDADDDATDFSGVIAGGWQLDITSVNAAPRTQPDTYQVRADQVLTVPALGVLKNDRDPDNDEISAVLQTEPRQGEVTLQPDGSFTYSPTNKTARVTDTFTYAAQDTTGLQSMETVTIEISGVDIKKNNKHKKNKKHKKHRR